MHSGGRMQNFCLFFPSSTESLPQLPVWRRMSAVGRPQAGQQRNHLSFPVRARYLCLQMLHSFWAPSILLFKLTTHMHLLSRLRMSGVISILPNTSSWSAGGLLCLILLVLLLTRIREVTVPNTTPNSAHELLFAYQEQLSKCYGIEKYSEQNCWRPSKHKCCH